jgi:hypothetical protein
MFYWMVPFFSDLTLGADYPIFSINEQMEILFSIQNGSFPQYVPGYKFGHSSSALTLSQVYHPLSHIASILPGYWAGKALEWNTFLRLLSLGLVHMLLFAFLRKIRVNTLFSFLLSLITVYNLRMLEAFRYGASLEAYTATLLLCTVICWYFISPSRWLGPLCITGATYLLICSGHPPMMFYGMLGTGIITLIAPFFLETMLPDRNRNFKFTLSFWIKAGLYVFLGILLSSAYIVPFYFEFVTNNIEYTQFGLQAHMGQDTLAGAFNNFFMPLVSDVLSTFGGSSLIIMPLLLPLLQCFNVRIPPAVWAVWCLLLFAFLYILGPATPVFRLAWEHLPLISSAGGVGRISIITPFLMMLLLAWIINAESFQFRFRTLSVKLPPYALLGLIGLILIPIYLLPVFLLKPTLGYFTPHNIRKLPFWIEFMSVFFGMASLAALVLYGMYPRSGRKLGALMCLMVVLHLGILMKYGTFIEEKYDKPTFEQMMTEKKEKLDFNFRQNPGLFHAVVLNHLRRTFVEPYLGKIYTQVIPVDSQDSAYNKMERQRLPQQAFVEDYDPDKAKALTEGAMDVKEGTVELIYSSYNRLQLKVDSSSTALFGLSYPYTGHWRAWVNGQKAPLYRANGAAHAVEIPAGENSVEFRYWSNASYWGVFISCTTFAAIGLFICFRSFNGLRRIIGTVLVLTAGAGGFILWYFSLHSGDNLNTQYSWSYTAPQYPPNIAYGKKTSAPSVSNAFLTFSSRTAVDGETERGSGFAIKPEEESALIVDLNQKKEIKKIVIYGTMKSQPLISLSEDGSQWHSIPSLNEEGNQSNPLIIHLRKGERARFVRIKPFESDLEIDEVEIY